jgi:hypothetical protein
MSLAVKPVAASHASRWLRGVVGVGAEAVRDLHVESWTGTARV